MVKVAICFFLEKTAPIRKVFIINMYMHFYIKMNKIYLKTSTVGMYIHTYTHSHT